MDDARVYEAATATELVDRLRALSFLEHGDAADFMAKMAANYAAWDGAIIRADNGEIFVVDHVQYGFLDRA
ncbi:MAG: hypothetical protein KIT00_13070 [Rhodospirillales bacterium]|nr:hypothetical protein [Rhodospirillales bacterium]